MLLAWLHCRISDSKPSFYMSKCLLTHCACTLCVLETQVFDIEALTKSNTSVAGVSLRVRPPGFTTDKRLPRDLSEQASRLLVVPGEPACKPAASRSICKHRSRALSGSLPASAARSSHLDTAHYAQHSHSGCGPWVHSTNAGPECAVEQQLPNGQRQLLVPAGQHGEVLAHLLGNYSSAACLHFTNVTAAFAGFKLRANQEAFEGLLSIVVAEWCCRSAQRVMAAGVPDGHLHQIRPFGSPQRFCAKRLDRQKHGDRVHSYFC